MRWLLLLAAALACDVRAEHWAVIVAGSRGYENYRHQADACHAYHVARRHGIPRENVVLMMYDDVAHDPQNPFPDHLFNRPTTTTGNISDDVYAGCEVDYRGKDVTPANFLSVLLGNATATRGKKVLHSGAADRVFVNFVDHGARGFVVFPHGEMLTASELTGALREMHARKRYKELVFYVEACHSGSMFWSWSMSHINAYVTTAANGWESSWGTYCPPYDMVNGLVLGTCLGDLYSVSWMEDSDKTDLSAESLEEQFRLVRRETSKSHVEQFGSSRVRKEIVGDFLSNYDLPTAAGESGSREQDDSAAVASRSASAVDAHDVPLVVAFYKYLRAPAGAQRAALAGELMWIIDARQQAEEMFEAIRKTFRHMYADELRPAGFKDSDAMSTPGCDLRDVVEIFGRLATAGRRTTQASDMPLGFTSYSLQYAGVLTDLCARLASLDAVEAVLRCAIVPRQCDRTASYIQ